MNIVVGFIHCGYLTAGDGSSSTVNVDMTTIDTSLQYYMVMFSSHSVKHTLHSGKPLYSFVGRGFNRLSAWLFCSILK
jgi:hypothetical protein